MLKGKNILLGVTGGIAAYRACDLARDLLKEGASVRVMMTASAARFVPPLTFRTLTGSNVHTDLFETPPPGQVLHIDLAKWASLVLIAPATANCIGKIASGIADDLLTTTVMALPQKTHVALAPAMNVEMWQNPIVRKNVEFLRGLGKYHIIQPSEGLLACGDVGEGKIADNTAIVEAVRGILG